MTDSSETSSLSPTFQQFLAPLIPFQEQARNQYRCHAVDDWDWIQTGLQRVIGQHVSGCAYLQKRAARGSFNLTKSNYFESCKSPRRYRHVKGLTADFLLHHSQHALKHQDLFADHPASSKALNDFHLYAGDGHFHAASTHDPRDSKQRKNPIGHLYAFNLRNHHLSHLALGSDGKNKKPHDMGVLKKQDPITLRQGALKGQKVLYIWDRAGIDFQQWYHWKNNNGIYFLSRVKENMVLEQPLPQDFDRDDPMNAGVISDELVSNQSGTMIRRVRFRVPDTAEIMEFLTNLGKSISPGLVAQLYFMRWRIEKSFDEVKNKLHEAKAWATSEEAKKMQASFIVLAYNLARHLREKVIEDQKNDDPERPHRDRGTEKKREKRLKGLEEKVSARGDQLPLLRKLDQKASQLSVKFYRWLESNLYDPSSWRLTLGRLQTIFDRY